MPLIDWTPEHKRTTSLEFDRLKLKVGEKARIVCLQKPVFVWTHTLRAPKISDGRATKIVKKRKDGSEYPDWDMEFIGRPQCLGDLSTIADDGSDPKNCPACAHAKNSEEVYPPERRFAMNVIRYNTKGDGTPISPFGCSSLVWTFTENVFNKLYAIAEEHGGLVGRDLILGPCQPPETFQKFDIATGAKNLWESDDSIRTVVTETHENNALELQDLETACGRRPEARWLTKDIDKIRDQWRIAHGIEPADTVTTEKTDVRDLKGELDNLLAPPAPTTAPAAAAAEQPPASAGDDPDDFSKLLAGLKL